MKLDATDLRYVTSDEFRVLTAVEMGSKNHEIVPTVLIVKISGLRNGGVNKLLGSLAKRNLVSRVQNARYDGYRLTYGGYDYLAMRAMSKRDSVYSVGNQIGVGKESDIYIVADKDGNELVLKLHRLGRISFRAIKAKRDYMGKRKSASWMYMSRLAAEKEYAFMKVLYEHDFPVPRPVDQARHCILMGFIDAYPLRQVADVASPGELYSTLMDLIVRFARAGLVHGDFNEFNILIRRDTGEPVVIDFPQMVSTSHKNAEWYFNRDVECIRRFFRRRFRYESSLYPRFRTIKAETDGRGGEGAAAGGGWHLDLVVCASGYDKGEQKVLEEYMDSVAQAREDAGSDDEDEDKDEDEDEDSDGEGHTADDDVQDGADDDSGGEEHASEEEEDSKVAVHAPGVSEMGRETETEDEDEDDEEVDGVPIASASTGGREGHMKRRTHQSREAAPRRLDDGELVAGNGSAALAHNDDGGDADAASRADPPRSSGSRSPSALADRTAALSLDAPSASQAAGARGNVADRVQTEVAKQRAREQRKHHSKKGAQRTGGRPRGSKRKQDTRIKADGGGFWD